MMLNKYTYRITSETKGREDLAGYMGRFFNIRTNCIGWHVGLINDGMIVQPKAGGREYHFVFGESGEDSLDLYERAKKIRYDFIIHLYDDISNVFLDQEKKVAAFSAEPLETY